MRSFAEWLAGTPPSLMLAQSSWIVPTAQTIHIVAISILWSSVLMVGLRLMGWAARSQALSATVERFRPWFWYALSVLAVTGIILIVTEPPRELLAVSFWLKMSTLAVAIALSAAFLRSVDRNAASWETVAGLQPKVLGTITFSVWCLVVFLGRFIAYDEQIWGFSAMH